MPISWLALAATILCSGGGNIVANWSHRFSGIWHFVVLAMACALQVLGLVFYTIAITGIPLSIAYSILIGSSLVLVTTVSALWFKERLSNRHLLGLMLIIAGMLMIGAGETSRFLPTSDPVKQSAKFDAGVR
jgi:Membrane transporters of cations and cationic drugs